SGVPERCLDASLDFVIHSVLDHVEDQASTSVAVPGRGADDNAERHGVLGVRSQRDVYGVTLARVVTRYRHASYPEAVDRRWGGARWKSYVCPATGARWGP